MSLDEFIQKLSDAGWRGLADAQHTEIVKVWDELMCESPRMMEITRLRAELAEARKDAERGDWLIHSVDSMHVGIVIDDWETHKEYIQRFRTAIDAAIAKEKSK